MCDQDQGCGITVTLYCFLLPDSQKQHSCNMLAGRLPLPTQQAFFRFENLSQIVLKVSVQKQTAAMTGLSPDPAGVRQTHITSERAMEKGVGKKLCCGVRLLRSHMLHAVPQLKGCPSVGPTPGRGLARCRAISSRWANCRAAPHPEISPDLRYLQLWKQSPTVCAVIQPAKQAESNSCLDNTPLYTTHIFWLKQLSRQPGPRPSRIV